MTSISFASGKTRKYSDINVYETPSPDWKKVAKAKVIHVGSDDCHRVEVLRRNGFEVLMSDSLDGLRLHLERETDVDAVFVTEETPQRAERAATLVRQHSGVPLILFRRSHTSLDESWFDRVYAPLVRPAAWLFETAVVIMQVRELRAGVRAVDKRMQDCPRRWPQALAVPQS